MSLSVKISSEVWSVFCRELGGKAKLQKYDGTKWTDYTESAGVPSDPRIVSVGINNNVFVAAKDTIVKYDGTVWTTIGVIETGQINAMKTSASGDLYVAVADSLKLIRHYNGNTWENFPIGCDINDRVLSMAIDIDGTIYAGTPNGLYRVKNSVAELFIKDNKTLPVSSVNKLIVDKSGKLWARSESGVLEYDGDNWKVFTNSNGLPNTNVKTIALSESGEIWAGTQLGIGVYDGSSWRKYTTVEGLSNNNVKQIVSSPDGKIYARSTAGIDCFDGVSWSEIDTYGNSRK